MEQKDLTELRNNYFQAIRLLNNEEDILSNLPDPYSNSFEQLMYGLIKMLNEELEEVNKMIESDYDDLDILIEDKKVLEFKINACNKLLESRKEEEKDEEDFANNESEKNLIFATRGNENQPYILKDIKNISSEYYEKIASTLDQIVYNYDEDNSEKSKTIRSSNKKLAGLQEKKGWKIRTFYQILDKDCAFVIMTRVKKSDNDKAEREEPIIRKQHTDSLFKQLKKDLKDPKLKQKIIEENKEMYEEIMTVLKKEKRFI